MIKEEYCPTVSAFRTHKVAKQKPVPVSIYDYYDSCKYNNVNVIYLIMFYISIWFKKENKYSNCKIEIYNIAYKIFLNIFKYIFLLSACTARKARAFYEPRKTTLCDLCEDEDCEDICVSKPGKQKDNTVSAASHIYTCIYLQFMFFSFYYLLHKYL